MASILLEQERMVDCWSLTSRVVIEEVKVDYIDTLSVCGLCARLWLWHTFHETLTGDRNFAGSSLQGFLTLVIILLSGVCSRCTRGAIENELWYSLRAHFWPSLIFSRSLAPTMYCVSVVPVHYAGEISFHANPNTPCLSIPCCIPYSICPPPRSITSSNHSSGISAYHLCKASCDFDKWPR